MSRRPLTVQPNWTKTKSTLKENSFRRVASSTHPSRSMIRDHASPSTAHWLTRKKTHELHDHHATTPRALTLPPLKPWAVLQQTEQAKELARKFSLSFRTRHLGFYSLFSVYPPTKRLLLTLAVVWAKTKTQIAVLTTPSCRPLDEVAVTMQLNLSCYVKLF